ncbi:MAG: hypothetical protein HYX60_11330 [Legionella longbeachae]|nr:hypothetical protein [Legionella longbeachae]
MNLFTFTIEIIFALFLLDKFGLWLERKGWLYYRHEKSQGGVCGSVLQELNALLTPNNRHVIEMKHNQAKYKKSEADAPSEPIDLL